MKFAILLTTYNGAKHLRAQLDSLIDQTVELDIFVSDDQSTDGTLSILKEYAKRFSNLEIVEHDIKFGGAAKNFYFLIRNLTLTNYDYVAFSDQDDIWLPDKLAFSAYEIADHCADGFSADCIAFWEEEKSKRKIVKKSYPQTKYDYWFESPGPGCTQVFTVNSFEIFQTFVRKNWNAIQDIDYHDWLVYAFYRHSQLNWLISPIPKVLYRQHETNQMGAHFGLKQAWKRLMLIRQYWYRNQVNTIYKMCTNSDTNLVKLSFMLKNAVRLRRTWRSSILIAALYVFGVL